MEHSNVSNSNNTSTHDGSSMNFNQQGINSNQLQTNFNSSQSTEKKAAPSSLRESSSQEQQIQLICGVKNQHGEPCQRIGNCPFHSQMAQNSKDKGAPKKLWTKDEHVLFLKGIQKFGRGNWKDITAFIGTKTSAQIQSHAQKYFLRQKQSQDKSQDKPSGNSPVIKSKKSVHDYSLEELEQIEVETLTDDLKVIPKAFQNSVKQQIKESKLPYPVCYKSTTRKYKYEKNNLPSTPSANTSSPPSTPSPTQSSTSSFLSTMMSQTPRTISSLNNNSTSNSLRLPSHILQQQQHEQSTSLPISLQSSPSSPSISPSSYRLQINEPIKPEPTESRGVNYQLKRKSILPEQNVLNSNKKSKINTPVNESGASSSLSLSATNSLHRNRYREHSVSDINNRSSISGSNGGSSSNGGPQISPLQNPHIEIITTQPSPPPPSLQMYSNTNTYIQHQHQQKLQPHQMLHLHHQNQPQYLDNVPSHHPHPHSHSHSPSPHSQSHLHNPSAMYSILPPSHLQYHYESSSRDLHNYNNNSSINKYGYGMELNNNNPSFPYQHMLKYPSLENSNTDEMNRNKMYQLQQLQQQYQNQLSEYQSMNQHHQHPHQHPHQHSHQHPHQHSHQHPHQHQDQFIYSNEMQTAQSIPPPSHSQSPLVIQLPENNNISSNSSTLSPSQLPSIRTWAHF